MVLLEATRIGSCRSGVGNVIKENKKIMYCVLTPKTSVEKIPSQMAF